MDVQSTQEKKSNVFSYVLGYLRTTWRYIKGYSGILNCIKLTSLSLFLVYFGIPVFVKANSWILPKIVFANLLHWPPFINLSNPADFGLNNTRHFTLNVEDEVHIGVWHILPGKVAIKNEDVHWESFDKQLGSGNTVFLYLHGNSGTRGAHHRVQLYKVLSKMDFHVVTLDYRGYGDSTGVPTENGLVADAYFTYKWLKERTRDSNIFIWGHSLGTGVATKLAKKLCDEGDHPAGVVLESPFNNMREAAFHHPFSMPYRMLPWFESIFVDGIQEQGILFQSDESILSVTAHILILHAHDDFIVPFHLGKKLYDKAKDTRNHKSRNIRFVEFESHLGYGHKLIYQAPNLPDFIQKFIEESK